MNTAEAISEHVERCNARLEAMGPGPWQSESHYRHFKAHGLDCVISRNSSLFFWCGYVGLPKTHPWFGKNYDDVEVEVHGGLTYGKECDGHICHVTQPGEPDDLYWVGFDCWHCDDLAPGMLEADRAMKRIHPELFSRLLHGIYRLEEYVVEETTQLAKQLSEMA